MKKRKTTKEIIELFQKDRSHILFKPIDYNKFIYLDSNNEWYVGAVASSPSMLTMGQCRKRN